MGWTLRSATPDDVPAIVGVLNAVLPPADRVTEKSVRFDDGMMRAKLGGLRLGSMAELGSDKDGERFVGLSGVMTLEGRPAYTYFTGVHREYRGRGLATLLKLATIEFVRGLGLAAMRTNNDTLNYPMVAVNEKLGYRRLPARVAMKRYLAAG